MSLPPRVAIASPSHPGWPWQRFCMGLAGLVLIGTFMSLATIVDPNREDALTVNLLIDRDGLATLSDVVEQPAEVWSDVSGQTPNLGYTSAALWLRIALPEWRGGGRILELGDPLLQHVDVHVYSRSGALLARHAMGTSRPFAERPQRAPMFAVPLTSAASRGWVLVRVQSETSVQVPVSLWTRESFEERMENLMLRNGIYIGVVAAMLFHNLLVFLSIRETAFLWYSGWVASFSLFILTLGGLSFQWFWPQSPDWNLISLPVTLALAVAVGSGFFTCFPRDGAEPGKGDRLIGQLAWLSLALAVASFWLPYRVAIHLVIANAMAVILLSIVFAAWRAQQGCVAARHFLMAFSFVALGGVVLALTRIGVLPRNDLTEVAPQLGAALEMLMLSLALAARINNERRLRSEAQAELIEAQLRQNLELEARVEARTRELNLVNQRLERISRTDGLTNLSNRRHLDECLRKEVRRAIRNRSGVGLLMLDVDHFKRLNDTFGHQAGDVCLRALADVLRNSARRGGDLVARYGGEEFCILVPDASEQDCLCFAESIRQQIERAEVRCDGVVLKMTVSIGVAWRDGSAELSPACLVQCADRALYAAKSAGRNRVSVDAVLPLRACG